MTPHLRFVTFSTKADCAHHIYLLNLFEDDKITVNTKRIRIYMLIPYYPHISSKHYMNVQIYG